MSSQFAIPSLSWSCKTYISGLHAYRLAMLVILVLELSIIHWLLWVKYNFIFVFFFVCFFFFCYKYFLRDCLHIFSGLVVYSKQPNHCNSVAAPPSCSASWTREHISRLTVVQVMGKLGEGLGIRLSLEHKKLYWQYKHHIRVLLY